MDGTGNPWFPADIAVKGGRIAAIGQLPERAGRARDRRRRQVRHAGIHRHSLARRRWVGTARRISRSRSRSPIRAEPRLAGHHHRRRQPGRPLAVARRRSASAAREDRHRSERDVAGRPRHRAQAASWARTCGGRRRPDEIARMRALVKQALQEGAVGMSAGLEYDPGRWSTTDEVVELAKELPAFNGVYISHERSEGSDPLWYVPSQDGPELPSRCSTRCAKRSRSARRPARASSPHTSKPRASTTGARAPRRSR